MTDLFEDKKIAFINSNFSTKFNRDNGTLTFVTLKEGEKLEEINSVSNQVIGIAIDDIKKCRSNWT